ncbi:hypothetical protein CAPTEDRAFT_152000 [Capitella teleta]|uniref:Multidrug and toxin extrusion protein n=1 Tax=Capitella teleta TaxID=283909 RepID=R7UJS0_CAPTE|nr:hypothetical protein CAPTEDRAFT_152000 [Capitella teleta]|eukprot:ELU03497.1 hypothetical protein CAPTEDRAFT_152000 [Capitella teleta]
MSWREFYTTLYPDGYFSEFKKSMKIGVPMTFAVFCQLIIQPLAILFGGHMGMIALGTLGLANSIISVLCNTMYLGLTCACDTLFSQVGGSNNKVYLGILVQRSIVAFSLVAFIVYGINLNMATFLITMGQDPGISVLVGHYLVWFMPAVPCFYMLKVTRNYTILYGETKSYFASGIAGVILALIFNYVFVDVLEFGLMGSASAQNIAFIVSTLGYILYVVRLDFHRKFFPVWNWRLFEKWGEFFELAIAGVFMTSLELWAFEISVFLAGLLGTVDLGAQSIVFNLDMMLYALPAGLSIACAIRTGQCLGAGRPTEARSACYVSISCIFLTTLIPTTLYATLRHELPKLFTNDKEVIALAAELLPFVAFYNVFMNLSIVMRGVLRGIGKQRVGSVVITISYYVLALPIGSCLMFLTPLGTKGLWISFCCALVLNSTIYTIYLTRYVDWVELAGMAQKRANHGRADETTGLINAETTKATVVIDGASDSVETKSKAQEWLDAEMPRDLKIKSAFYMGIPILFFIVCIIIKLTCSYDEEAILGALRTFIQNRKDGFNSTTVSPQNATLIE